MNRTVQLSWVNVPNTEEMKEISYCSFNTLAAKVAQLE